MNWNTMQLGSCISALLAFTAGPSIAAASRVSFSAARVDSSDHDFGQVWSDATLTHTFTLNNQGDAALEIQQVKPACGCTVAGDYPRRIEPGQSGQFPFSLKASTLNGKFDKSISIFTNDPKTPELKLYLRGEVRRYIEVSPAGAYFGKFTGTQPVERVLTISNNSSQPLELTLQSTQDGPFRYELKSLDPGRRRG